MYDNMYQRLADGFQPYDWWMILTFSLVAALIIRKWPQLPAAAALAFIADAFAPFIFRVATGVPMDLASQIAMSRIDDRGGLVVLLRLGFYIGTIALVFFLRRRYAR